MEGEGPQAERLVAFRRNWNEALALVVVPRLVAPLVLPGERPLPEAERWGQTVVRLPEVAPGTRLTDLFTGAELTVPEDGRLPVASLLAHFPVACCVAGIAPGE